jgi:hypothetical protein
MIPVGILTAPSSSGLDPATVSFNLRVIAAGGSLTTTELNAINTLVTDLKSAGIWNLMKVIYPIVGGTSSSCGINLVNSSFTGIFTAGWLFSSDGITPNGTSDYMDTVFNTSINLIKTSAHLSLYVRNNTASGLPYDFANAANTGMTIDSSYLITRYAGNFSYFGIADPTYGTGVNVSIDSQGFWCGSRITNTQFFYRNGIQVGTGTAGSTNLANNNLYLGAANGNGTAVFFANKQYAFATIGESLSSIQALSFYNAVQTFQTTLSRQV